MEFDDSSAEKTEAIDQCLDELYLPCVDRMLEAHWVEGCDESLPRRTCV